MRGSVKGMAISSALWFAVGVAHAQTNDDVNAGIQFNFSTPGARSLGMGGAFLGLADDATAAYANPAGLTNLTVGGSEVSVEFRRWGYTNRFPNQGHFAGPPSGIGADTIEGVQSGEDESTSDGISFLSFAYVLPRGWTFALYRHQLADFEAQASSQGLFIGSSRSLANGGRDVFRIFPSRSRLSLDIVNYGASGSYRLLESPILGTVSLGLGVSAYRARLRSATQRFSPAPQDRNGDGRVEPSENTANREPGGFYGPPDFLGDNINSSIVQEADDGDWGINAGFLWKIGKNEHWSIGAAYREGPDFQAQAQFLYGPVEARTNPRHRVGDFDPELSGDTILHVPDVLGVGVAWSPKEGRTRWTLDYDRVLYSRMTEDLSNVLVRAEGIFRSSEYRVNDADELHLGFEYVFLVLEPQLVATVRFGGWQDPGHSIEYIGPDSVLQARFQPSDDQVHFSTGVGLVIGENFQVDTAFDHSERVDTLSVSLVKFF